jgi:phage replication O-like protein O
MATSGAEIQIDKGGYTRIHNAILEQLAYHDFTSREYACIIYLLRMTYGFSRKDCELSNGDFATATNLERTAIIKTLRRLVERNVFVKVEGDPYHAATWSFNKYFEQWADETSVKTTTSDETTSSRFDTTTSSRFDTSTSPQIDTSTSDETATSYLWAKESIKESIKERETPPSGPTFSERNGNGYFGMPVPFKSERVIADGYTQDAAKLGVNAEVYVQIFNALINIAGWRGLVDAGDSRSLNWAKEDALKIISLGHNTPEHIAKLAAAYRKAYHWKGAPTPKGLAEYASQLQAGVAPTGDKPARVTAEDEAKAQADLRAAKSRIATNVKLGAKPNPRDEAIVARYQNAGAH